MKIENLTPDKVILEELGERLSRIRKQKKLSQDRLAEEAGIGVATLRRIEDGSDSQMGSWIKILKALHMETAIDSILPETFRSPMAEAKAERSARANKPTKSSTGGTWGDQNK